MRDRKIKTDDMSIPRLGNYLVTAPSIVELFTDKFMDGPNASSSLVKSRFDRWVAIGATRVSKTQIAIPINVIMTLDRIYVYGHKKNIVSFKFHKKYNGTNNGFHGESLILRSESCSSLRCKFINKEQSEALAKERR